MSNLVLRSLMFVPAHNEKLILSASKSKTDAIILDLEDSVPDSSKRTARVMIRQSLPLFKQPVFIRINGKDSPNFWPDIDELRYQGFQGIVYPKATNANEITDLSDIMPGISVIPLIETAGAVLNCQSICEAPSVIAVAFGCEDYTADLQGIHSHAQLSVPRAMIAMAARTARVIPIDTVHINVHDLDELESEAMFARSLGFEGMLVLHPKELPIVHKVFTPSDLAVSEAREMLRLSKEATANNKGVAYLNGRFIGPPLVRQAQAVLDRYERIQRWESSL